ncbi:lipoprotein-releasing ABC transporter permease subunit [Steroidobacter sp. S1-65]|uniref:Lipoprotein-releasing ABC transporter permease subunit n=1 Tax=Steroidobacter gossypii TaxID=2805490 RepID=A0ABS1WW05_9GAMM|nr:lipoprotein-releasing ABC transporter permease subunit [Steroidobacter gossypii]MBM0105138.1 lipoprotein-releasing ABC transporter permease subunit [Steroidobacter gossypii]
MSKRYEFLIGRRYLRSTRGNRFVSFISTISMLGIAIGVAVLIVVLSVMNGFEREVRGRILSLTSHASISAFGSGLPDWQGTAAKIEEHPEVVASAPYIEAQALLIAGSKSSGAVMTGVLADHERKVTSITEKMASGSFEALEPGSYGIVLGSELAKALEVSLGDRVIVVTSLRNTTPVGVMPRHRGFKVVGIFNAAMYEFDRNMAYVNMEDAARLYRMGDQVTGVRLKLSDMFLAPQLVRELALSLGGGYYIDDWTRKHANFFRSIQLTKSAMFLILLLVVAVAAFNIVSTLVMVVKDKRADIAILRTIGASPRGILTVFMTQGTAIGFIGTVAGVALGVLISVNLETLIHGLEALLGVHFLDAKVYYISDLPATVQWADVIKISVTTFLLCSLSTLYPAWRAARTQPAQSLRHD